MTNQWHFGQCAQCGLLKSSGVTGTVLPQCMCDWKMQPSKEEERMNEENKFDIVLVALQEKRDRLWKMNQQNMNADMFNIMDQIRLEQIDELDRAMAAWKKSKE